MRGIVAQAADLWGFDPARITLVAQRENAVWRAETSSGSFALRLHRVGYRTETELASELAWIAVLKSAGMAVPRPIVSQRGVFVEVIDSVAVDVLTWLPGRIAGAHGALEGIKDRGGYMTTLGAVLAQLHDVSDAWSVPDWFSRPRWDPAGLVGDKPLWGKFWDNPDLSFGDRALVLAAKARAQKEIAEHGGGWDFGLIHADAITENVMIHGDALSLIDFDDGGWGYRDFDLATVLMRHITSPDYPELKAALLAGYAVRRTVNATTLDLFLVLRALTYLGWIIPRRGEPGGSERSARALRTALPLVRAYLEAP